MNLRLIHAIPLVASTWLATDARAQEACVTETDSSFINFTYTPSRPSTLKNGRLSVLASDMVADNEHKYDTASRMVYAPLSNGALKAQATYNVLSGIADIETWLIGYGEAGIEVTMEARNSAGALLCSAEEELYIARYNETGSPTFGVRTLECNLSPSITSARISLTAHAWVTIGGATDASASTSIQIVNVGIESCSGSCSSSCGPVSASSGTCYCDDACSSYGDCCVNAATVCVPDSCWERCGSASANGTCYCDSACTTYGDCCEDEADSCG